jgi:aerobic-type carbon monoxide dehydrogenase small subunit (CoxS/CutS family)
MAQTMHEISFTLNGYAQHAKVQAHLNVVELLNSLELCGARESCSQGLCGVCTVLIDGEAVSGCLELAINVNNKTIETIEGLSKGSDLHPIQEAFIEANAFQCGFCTPGFILMTKTLLEHYHHPTEDQIKHYLSGNLCRCGAYPEIIKAVQLAAKKMYS